MLHTVNQSPFINDSLLTCLRVAKPGGAVLFIEDGVYAALKDTEKSVIVTEAKKQLDLFVLGPDLDARGVARKRIIEGIKVVDYTGFVELSVAHNHVQSWF